MGRRSVGVALLVHAQDIKRRLTAIEESLLQSDTHTGLCPVKPKSLSNTAAYIFDLIPVHFLVVINLNSRHDAISQLCTSALSYSVPFQCRSLAVEPLRLQLHPRRACHKFVPPTSQTDTSVSNGLARDEVRYPPRDIGSLARHDIYAAPREQGRIGIVEQIR